MPNPNHPKTNSGGRCKETAGERDEILQGVEIRQLKVDSEGFWYSEFLAGNSVARSEGTFVIGHVTCIAEFAAQKFATSHLRTKATDLA